MSNVCKHGSLARSCQICELEAEVARQTQMKEHYMEQWSEVCNENQKLLNEIAALREELTAKSLMLDEQVSFSIDLANQRDALREDAERLDYLDKHGKKNVFSIVDRWYTRSGYGMPYTKHQSLRAAIDAARSKQ